MKSRIWSILRSSAHWLVALVFASSFAQGAGNPSVDVILWFDTEDYLLPADDDASKRLAEMLTERGIRATFKIVGEKARVLERRGRSDVIDALKKQDIGFHANFHSVHPTPSEYLAEAGLLDGIAEFARREGGGAEDVRRIFGVATLSCYGQPGSSWGAQTMAGLKQIGVAPRGIACYVDEGTHVGLNEKPFWYAGALTVYHMGKNYTRMELHNPDAVEPAKKKFSEMADRLRNDGGGLISIFYHPCEWVHREFWDGVNFRRGANPPREEWKPPPQRTPAETEGAFQRFAQYVDHIRNVPNVRFVTASDLPALYPDRTRTAGATENDLNAIAKTLADTNLKGCNFFQLSDRAYSLADQFELLALSLGELADGKKPQFPRRAKGLLGPDNQPGALSQLTHLTWPAFRDTLGDVIGFIQTEQRIPSRVFVGPDTISPNTFLVAVATVYEFQRKNNRLPLTEGVPLQSGIELLPVRHVAKDTSDLFGGWIIHKENFRAPKILEIARLQAWTLKPAVRAQP